ncbi:MAG: MBL fold metallo-hydrolase [Methanobacterium formicicum]|uniref:MBL fold metallo-hydrolase n=1 Tax=Methanobacterium TaxID=2160 RepID=UPI002490BA9D|nr:MULTISPECIES: MBL fold metallo-hydrolase [Methanobacterium]MDD4810420.1 MBL fold metallo-hydrolase [Methanobacterium formicicum]
MKLIKSEGIAHHSYFIEASGRAIVVDPRRDVDIYLKMAETAGLDITHIFETHRNEDYVIGSLELAQATGAEIFHGKDLEFAYGTPVIEGTTFKFGNAELEILETPGHTPESISLVLRDKSVSDDAQMVFAGDLIFAGETGRIDLLGEDKKRKMAGLLYDSIFHKIMPLGDKTILCPAHGAGSVCGADIREQDYTTLGYEKNTNPQLQCTSRDDFIQMKVAEELYTPPYFRKMEFFNQNGAPLLGRLPYLRALTPKILKKMKNNGAQIVDVRQPTSFGGAHLPGSLNIWRDGVPAFAGWFLNYQDPIILIDDQDHNLDEIRQALVRLGFDNIYGYLAGGFPNWYLHAEKIETLKLWSVQQLKENLKNDFFLLDGRMIDDRQEGYIEGSHHIYTGEVPVRISEIPRDQSVVVYCDSGFKSTLICSYLKGEGFTDLTSVLGSMTAWKQAGYPVVKD